jgi:hypothetical protein
MQDFRQKLKVVDYCYLHIQLHLLYLLLVRLFEKLEAIALTVRDNFEFSMRKLSGSKKLVKSTRIKNAKVAL